MGYLLLLNLIFALGNILKHGGTYFMYGEHYGNSTGFDTNTAPTLIVYTSPDMRSWAGACAICP